jgi:hypothetical protein
LVWLAWASTRLHLVVYDGARIAEDDAEGHARIRALGQWYPENGTPSLFLIDAQGRQLGQRITAEEVGPESYIRTISERLGHALPAP